MKAVAAQKGSKRIRLNGESEAGPSAGSSSSRQQTSLLKFLGERQPQAPRAKTQEEIDLERALAESLQEHLEAQRTLKELSSFERYEETASKKVKLESGETPTAKPSLEAEVKREASPLRELDSKSARKHEDAFEQNGDASVEYSEPSKKLRPLRPITELANLCRPVSVCSPSSPPKFEEQVGEDAISDLPIKSELNKGKGNAFSVLMQSHTESKEWAKADAVEAANYRGKARTRPEARTAPFYKVLQGMPLSVDAFRFGKINGCTGYFLTHFHSDHYGGITSNWNHGPIYCSKTTANLVRTVLRVEERWIKPLPMETPTMIPDSGGVRVTCIEANHCPGSCLFLFEGPQTVDILPTNFKRNLKSNRISRYLHCGDFRASPLHVNHPLIKGKKLDIIYLDTTYLNPRYCFPAQEQVVDACVELVRSRMPSDQAGSGNNAGASGAIGLPFQSAGAVAMRNWLRDGTLRPSSTGADATESAELETTPPPLDDDLPIQDEPIPEEPFDDIGEEDWPPENLEEEPAAAADDLDTSVDSDTKTLQSEAPGPAQDAAPKPKGRLLVLVGTYTIGKEKIVKAVAKTLGSPVFCMDSRKYRVYAQLEDPELHAMLTRDPGASVHVTNLQAITGQGLRDTVAALRARGHNFTHAIAFRPTGWTYKPPAGMDLTAPSLERLMSWNQSRNYTAAGLYPTRDSTPEYMIYGVPYSEHSSFFELSAFALSVNYDRIIATVNVGSATSRNKMSRWFEKWAQEKRRRKKDGLPDIVPARAEEYW